MINFDPSKVKFHIVRLKTITTALGGSINIVDTINTVGKKEQYLRIEVPLAVARAYIKAHNTTRYLVAIPACIMTYENKVVAIEGHPLGSLAYNDDGTLDWKPLSVINYERKIEPMLTEEELSKRKWYFDGRFMFCFKKQDLKQAVLEGAALTSDQKFRKVDVVSIDLMAIHTEYGITPDVRTCLAFIASENAYGVSPPVWKDLGDVGEGKLQKSNAENDKFRFDSIDEHLSVNLNFALRAGTDLSRLFGFEAIEPLQLPRLMVDLHTVNLPNTAQQIKATTDIGLTFTHTIAWLLGLLRRVNTLDAYIVIRALMKYLTTKGIFNKDTFKTGSIFKEGFTGDVPVLSQRDFEEKVVNTQFMIEEIVSKVKGNEKPKYTMNINTIGTLHTDGGEE